MSVPFPRTSGARFCGAGKFIQSLHACRMSIKAIKINSYVIVADLLVVFTRPSHLHRINAPTDDTPRSLSALSAYLASRVVLPLKGRTTSSSPAQYSLVYPVQPGVTLAQSPSEASVSISSFYHQDRVSLSVSSSY